MKTMTRFFAAFPLVMSLVLATTFVSVSATPSQASILGCLLFGNCGGGGGGGGGGSGDDGDGASEDAEETGIIHTVFIVGDTFLPEEVHASVGDQLKIYNLTNGSIKVRADDHSWNTGYLSTNQSWSMVLQSDSELGFRKSTFGHTSLRGEVKLANLPDEVNFGDLVDADGNVIGKTGAAEEVAEGLAYTLADVSGPLQDVGQGLNDLLGGGNGNGNGLTNDYGNGNNDDDDDDDDDDDGEEDD